MKITFFGHSGFLVDSGPKVIIDPFLTGNSLATIRPASITLADLVLVTHAHPDHLGDAWDIVKRTGATLVATHDLAMSGEIAGAGMNFGGTLSIRGLSVTMVKADHAVGMSDAAGFVWKQGGMTLYHMGDTSIFSDLKLIAELYRPDILFVPIGDRYTMGPREAALATSWIRPKIVFPMHYRTFPFLVQDADEFKKLSESLCPARVLVPEPGQTIDIQ